MSVFVTVGTTSFDDLIEAVDSSHIKGILQSKGYKQIICQIGQGTYVPTLPNFSALLPSLNDFIQDSDLIISHAGAGTIIDCLRLSKKLIVVVNPKLMNNHQLEIAETLASKKHLVMCASPKELSSTLSEIDRFDPLPLPEPNTNTFFENMLKLL